MSEAKRYEVRCHRYFKVGLSADSLQTIAIRFDDEIKALTLEMAELLAVQLLRAVQYRRESIRIGTNSNVQDEIDQLLPSDCEAARADASFLRHYERVKGEAYDQAYHRDTKDASSEN